jgi:hypothetical protein
MAYGGAEWRGRKFDVIHYDMPSSLLVSHDIPRSELIKRMIEFAMLVGKGDAATSWTESVD